MKMEVKSIKDCLNRVDIMLFEKSLKCQVKSVVEVIRKHIERKQGAVVARGECIEK